MLTNSKVEEFLREYKRSRVTAEASTRATLNRALDYEQKFHKPFYEFTEDEIKTMYKAVDAISERSLQNINLALKHAARYFLYNEGKDVNNVYDEISKDLIQECVNVEKKNSLILSRQDLSNLQSELLNYTDKAILELLFLGVGGKWLRELTFFDMSQVSRKEGLVYFRTGKIIPISEDVYDLIKRAYMEDELISFGETMRVSKVKSHGIFKQRFNSLSASDNSTDEKDLERRFRFIQRRLLLMSGEYGVQLTSGNLQSSGLLHHLKQGIEETELSFREYVKTDEARELARRYDIYSELAPQILLEKFERYF